MNWDRLGGKWLPTDTSIKWSISKKELYHTTPREVKFIDRTWHWTINSKKYEIIFTKDNKYRTNYPKETPIKDLPDGDIKTWTWKWDLDWNIMINWEDDEDKQIKWDLNKPIEEQKDDTIGVTFEVKDTKYDQEVTKEEAKIYGTWKVKYTEGNLDGEVAFLKDMKCKWKPRKTGVWGKTEGTWSLNADELIAEF